MRSQSTLSVVEAPKQWAPVPAVEVSAPVEDGPSEGSGGQSPGLDFSNRTFCFLLPALRFL